VAVLIMAVSALLAGDEADSRLVHFQAVGVLIAVALGCQDFGG
jgi:hypothetical protein